MDHSFNLFHMIQDDKASDIIAAVLAGVSPYSCSRVLSDARSKAASLPRYSSLLWGTLTAATENAEQVQRRCDAYGSLISAAATAAPGETMTDIKAKTMSTLTGSPYAGDPNDEYVTNELPLAMAVSQLGAIVGSDHVDDLGNPTIYGVADEIARLYDCGSHQHILGGSPLQGGILKNIKKKLSGKAKEVLGSAVNAVTGVNAMDSLSGKGQATLQREEAEKQAILAAMFPQYVTIMDDTSEEAAKTAATTSITQRAAAYSALGNPSNIWDDLYALYKTSKSGKSERKGESSSTDGVATNLAELMTDAQDQIKSAIDDMQSLVDKQSELQETAKATGLNLARLAWAKAALGADDSAAKVMQNASPSFGSAKDLLNTAISTIPAAKSTGDVSTWKALIDSFKAAISSGSVSANKALGLLGDPASERQLVQSLAYGDSIEGGLADPTNVDRYQRGAEGEAI